MSFGGDPHDYYFILKKQKENGHHLYSFVDDNILVTLKQDDILEIKKIEERIYSLDEAIALRDELASKHK